jgi:putative FmdB family regulatory protein
MPTYEYECKSCGHTFEAFQAMSDEPLKSCPECGRDIRRLIFGGTGVIFKGSGFYVTDKGKAGVSAKASKSAGSGGDSGSSAPAAPAAAEKSGGGASGESASSESAPKKTAAQGKAAAQTA